MGHEALTRLIWTPFPPVIFRPSPALSRTAKSWKVTFTVCPEGMLWTSPSAPPVWALKSRMVWVIPAPFTVIPFLVERLSELVKW